MFTKLVFLAHFGLNGQYRMYGPLTEEEGARIKGTVSLCPVLDHFFSFLRHSFSFSSSFYPSALYTVNYKRCCFVDEGNPSTMQVEWITWRVCSWCHQARSAMVNVSFIGGCMQLLCCLSLSYVRVRREDKYPRIRKLTLEKGWAKHDPAIFIYIFFCFVSNLTAIGQTGRLRKRNCRTAQFAGWAFKMKVTLAVSSYVRV